MKLLEIINTIYKPIIERLDLSKEDEQFPLCLALNENYTFSLTVFYDADIRPYSISINYLDISDSKGEPMECDLKEIASLLEQKLNLYYDNLKQNSHVNS